MQELFSNSPLTFVAMVFFLSLLIGSFLNVVIYRLPIMMEREWRGQCQELAETPATETPAGRFDLVFPSSSCTSCGAQITAMQNVPILSYLMLGGKCGSCGEAISKRYPIVEAMTAFLTAVVALRFGFGLEAAAAIVLTWALIAISVIDIDHRPVDDHRRAIGERCEPCRGGPAGMVRNELLEEISYLHTVSRIVSKFSLQHSHRTVRGDRDDR